MTQEGSSIGQAEDRLGNASRDVPAKQKKKKELVRLSCIGLQIYFMGCCVNQTSP